MNANDSQILQTLERLGAQYPWDTVAIWIKRHPDGAIEFVAYMDGDYNRGSPSACGSGKTMAEACTEMIRDAGERDPDAVRDKKIRELRETIAKLEAANFGLPPYRPGTLLAPGALTSDIDV